MIKSPTMFSKRSKASRRHDDVTVEHFDKNPVKTINMANFSKHKRNQSEFSNLNKSAKRSNRDKSSMKRKSERQLMKEKTLMA